jgi:exoribonuclease-2
MNLLFEDDGQIKAGLIISETDASAHVELAGGRRIKVKSANGLLHFASPSAADLMAAATLQRADIDMALLWESAAGTEDFSFGELATEYFGASASAVHQAATLLALQQSPMYFYKRGKGRYKRAPEDALSAALAGVERKAREAEQIEVWVQALLAGQAPVEISANWVQLLNSPEKQSLGYRALVAAADRARMAPVHLLAKAGAIPSTHALHFQRFLRATFPKGIAFPSHVPLPAIADLPTANVRAFSIDDATTTEIDDALSVQPLASGGFRLGIHIAAPALAITINSELDRVARDRLSTVYMPGHKITMLPDDVIAEFSLDEGKSPAALSLYATVDAAMQVTSTETCVERVPIVSNLRLGRLDELEWMDPANDSKDTHGAAMRTLYAFAQVRAAARGEQPQNRVDYSFAVHGDADAADCRIEIWPRKRGSPVDTLVSELMIFTNVTWAGALAARKWPGMFRVQANGKTRMSSIAGQHEGLNVPHYLWATSPLRRYSDLLNQRQLLALVANPNAPDANAAPTNAGTVPAYGNGNAELLAAVADFDVTYSGYGEFQQQMEFYWCLRYIQQENISKLTAHVIRENLVRFDRLPLVQRINDMPNQPAGMQVILSVAEIDLFEPALHMRFIETVGVTNAPNEANAA